MIVNQWVPAAHRGDAIGDSARRVRDMLRAAGHESDIFALNPKWSADPEWNAETNPESVGWVKTVDTRQVIDVPEVPGSVTRRQSAGLEKRLLKRQVGFVGELAGLLAADDPWGGRELCPRKGEAPDPAAADLDRVP